MGITVYSPHDGEPVTVRDQDVGRAVRDRQKRIFYVLEKSDGSGYYGAMTRAPNTRDEERALEFEQKVRENRQHVSQEHAQAFDARGKPRGRKRSLVFFILLIVFGILGYLVAFGPLRGLIEPYLESEAPIPEVQPEVEPVGSISNFEFRICHFQSDTTGDGGLIKFEIRHYKLQIQHPLSEAA